MGRTYEGIAAMEAGVRLAERHGETAVALRGRNSISGCQTQREPQAALEILSAGIAEARRLGQRASMIRMLTNAAGASLEVGDPATAIREMSELLTSPLGREDRLFTQAMLLLAQVAAGADYEPLLREFDGELEAEQEPNVLVNLFGIRALVALAAGRYADSHANSLEAARLSPFNAPGSISMAGHAAAWARDPGLLAEALEAHVGTLAHGGVIDHRRAAMVAARAALDGRLDEAAYGFRTAIAGLHSVGALFEEALTSIDAVAILGPNADPALVTSARTRLEDAGTLGFLPALEALARADPAAGDRAPVSQMRARQTV
jgi:hypothetical protein